MSKHRKKNIPSTPEQAPAANNDVEEDMDISDDEEGGTRVGGIYIPPPVPAYCSTESKGPRLVIRFIENTNFKSYANTVRVGPFHHRFSAVIGPNGSGKSNVIDSMLFVFGYRAQQIRSKKLSVLLHNSKKYENVSSCKVAVHFQQIIDKEDGTFDLVPNTEIIVARTAFKNNSSFYSVNGREVKFKEVAELLKAHNIDLLHNRFLILQGEVESIAMMKPKALTPNECGLLEYLEDIIGTERYKKPLMLINDRLEKLSEERTEKNNRCRLAEREMKDLELPMTQAVEYLRMENKLYQVQNLHLQMYIFHKKIDIVKLDGEKTVSVQTLKDHDDKFAELKKQRQEKEKVIQDEIKKHDDLKKKLEECNSLEGKARAAHQKVDAELKEKNIRRKALKKQVDADEKKLVELQNLPEHNREEIAESEKQIERQNTEKAGLEKKLEENIVIAAKETKPLVAEKDPLEKEIDVLKAELDKRKADYTNTLKELEILRGDETTESRKYESLRHSLEETKKRLPEMQKAVTDAESELPEMKASLNTKKQELETLRKEEAVVAADLAKVRQKLEVNRTEMQTAQSNNRVLNALMKEKQKGKIPGILGRLGDLGAIDKKYDIAISTCCGRLDNIVVEDVNTAQQCIQYLKDNNLGRATFIALDKIDHLRSRYQNQQQYPQNVPRLFDLVRVEDDRVRPAFYYSLFETLVANNMDQASTIAYGQRRYRVVTLSGDVIETSGIMAGGGKQVISGRMGQKVQTKTAPSRNSLSSSELNRIEELEQTMKNKVNELQQLQGVLSEEIRQLMFAIPQKEKQVAALKVQLQGFAEQIPRSEDQLRKQKEKADKTKADSAKVAALQVKVDEFKMYYENKESEFEQMKAKVTALNKQISEIQDKRVKEVKLKIDKLTKQIAKLTQNINKLNADINSADRKIKTTEESIEAARADITEAENSMRKMAEERDQILKDIEALKTRIEDLKKQIEEATTDSSSIQKEIAKIQKEEAEGNKQRVDLEDQLKTLEKNIKEQAAKIPTWEKLIRALKLHEIPNEKMPDPPFKTYTDEEMQQRNTDDTQYEITSLEEQLMVNKPNLSAIAEYNKKQDVYMERVKILEDVTCRRNEMREAFDNVKKKRFTEFTEGFLIISRKLKEMYQMITLGGDAELELVDSMDPFSEGIVFSVRPPKKSWKVIGNLSGGEKTLSSLALVFALHYYKPSPLYFMDEIDAALDFKNVSIVANYINERTKNAQFIIISLRSNMFELADYLVGIYKVDDCTNSLTIQNYDKQRVLGIGESEGEKENYNGNLSYSLSPPPKISQGLNALYPQESSIVSMAPMNSSIAQPVIATVAEPGVTIDAEV